MAKRERKPAVKNQSQETVLKQQLGELNKQLEAAKSSADYWLRQSVTKEEEIARKQEEASLRTEVAILRAHNAWFKELLEKMILDEPKVSDRLSTCTGDC
ncbi:MAG: hypothetical protein KGI08_09265 [Thaumarchaeota archaeon]|nr:hypothetical protein [Nitrososphaerota archaeon]